ncbi:MAG: penicillin-binding protein 2, partial [Sulfurospirillum sp.]
LYYLSIKSNRYYEELAMQNVLRTEYLLPVRGEIRDRNGSLLAISRLGFSIALAPHLSTKKNRHKLHEALKMITQYFPAYKRDKLTKIYLKNDSPYNHKPIVTIPFLPYKEVIRYFVKLTNNGVIVIKPASKRFYPNGELASHIIGYVSKPNQKDLKNDAVAKRVSLVGKSGIEKYYNKVLEGELGKKILKVTASNKTIRTLQEQEPKNHNIALTIDIRLQKFIAGIFGNQSGALIVMNAKNGEILAAGSYPSYDINHFVQGISQKEWKAMITDLDHPFTNKFIRGLYPPGSSTKPAVALSFFNSTLIAPEERFLCSGEMELGRRKFRCWNQWGHGETNMTKAIRESCDIYFYKGGLRVGIDTISTDLKRYGFGRKTGVDLPGEFIGTVPDRNWKVQKFGEAWYRGETLNTVIGQGNFLVTPLQIAVYTATVATGKAPLPHFLKAIDDINVTFLPENLFTPREKGALPMIRNAMFEVCNHPKGTAYKHNISAVTMAGKTGTSQVIGIPQKEKKRMSENELKYYQKSHAWFTTFAPYENPQYVITAIIEHGGHGGSAAGEMVSLVYNKLVELGYIAQKYITHPNFLIPVDQNKTERDRKIPVLD